MPPRVTRSTAALRTPVLMFIVVPLSFLNEQKRMASQRRQAREHFVAGAAQELRVELRKRRGVPDVLGNGCQFIR